MSLETAIEKNTAALEAFGQLLQTAITTMAAAATVTAPAAPAAEVEKPKRAAAKKSNTVEAADAAAAEPVAEKVEAKVEETRTAARAITLDDIIPAFQGLMTSNIGAASELLAAYGVKRLREPNPDDFEAVAAALGVVRGA